MVYVREGTTNYLEDGKVYIINITSVTVTTYSDTTTSGGYSEIYTTDEAMQKISSKASFYLIKDITLDIDALTTGHGFTAGELSQIGRSGSTFEVTRSSITVDHIIAKRFAATTGSGMFMFLNYLQDKTMTLINTEFYVTGGLVTTSDPLNIHMENIYADTYNVNTGFSFITG